MSLTSSSISIAVNTLSEFRVVDSDLILTFVTDMRGMCCLPETKSSLRLRRRFIEMLIEVCVCVRVCVSGKNQCLGLLLVYCGLCSDCHVHFDYFSILFYQGRGAMITTHCGLFIQNNTKPVIFQCTEKKSSWSSIALKMEVNFSNKLPEKKEPIKPSENVGTVSTICSDFC